MRDERKIIYLLPWSFDEEGGCYRRWTFNHNWCVATIIVWQNGKTSKWSTGFYNLDQDYPSFEEARNACDKYLIAEGFILLSKERVEKLKLLL